MRDLDRITAFRKLANAVQGPLGRQNPAPSVLPHLAPSAELLPEVAEFAQLLSREYLPQFKFTLEAKLCDFCLGEMELLQP